MEDDSVEYIIKTTDKETIQLLLRAEKMQTVIESWHTEVFRPRLKYADDKYTAEEIELMRALVCELVEHFKLGEE